MKITPAPQRDCTRHYHHSISPATAMHLPAVMRSSPVCCVSVCPSRTVIPLVSIWICWSVWKWMTILLKPPCATESSSPFTDSSSIKENKNKHTWSTQILHLRNNTSTTMSQYLIAKKSPSFKIPQKHYQRVILEVSQVKVVWDD